MPMRFQKYARAIKEAMALVKMCATYRQVPCIDFCGDGQYPLARRDTPSVIVDLFNLQALTAAMRSGEKPRRRKPSKFIDRAAAGCPWHIT